MALKIKKLNLTHIENANKNYTENALTGVAQWAEHRPAS